MTQLIIILYIFAMFYLLIGYIMRNHYSEYPDMYLGYHVGRISGKNQSTWETANRYSGSVLIWSSCITLIINILITILYYGFAYRIVEITLFVYLITIAVLPVVFIFLLTEIHLHRRFDKDGNPKP